MAPVKEEDYYEVLSSFPTQHDIYEQKTKYTGNLHVTQCNYVKRYFERDNDGNNFISTCQKIATFIEYLQGNDNIGDKNITCKHLNYLINSEVKKFKYYPNETQEFYTKIIDEYETRGYPLKTVCNGFIEHLNNDIFVKIQKLYKLYYEIHKFKNMSAPTRECKMLDECVQLYTAYIEDCKEVSQDTFCKALKEFSHYCASHNSILGECPEERNSLLSYTLKESSDGNVADNDSVNNGSSNGTIISASSFTPIRSMIDPRIRKTKKTLENPIQRSDELHPHEHNDYLSNVNINRYNVGYQSR